MKFRGKAISGTSLILLLGVVFAITTIVAAVALSNMVTTPSRDVVEAPITLTLGADETGSYDDWLAAGDALKGTPYDFKVDANANWIGQYKLHIVVSSTASDLLSTDVTITYQIGAGTVTPIEVWEDTSSDLIFDLPVQESSALYAETYHFTIVVNNEIEGVHLDIQALAVA